MFRNTQRHNVTSSYVYSINCRIVNSVTADGCVHITESVDSRRELVANSCTHRRRDATRQFRRVGVGGVYWALESVSKKAAMMHGRLKAWPSGVSSWRRRSVVICMSSGWTASSTMTPFSTTTTTAFWEAAFSGLCARSHAFDCLISVRTPHFRPLCRILCAACDCTLHLVNWIKS